MRHLQAEWPLKQNILIADTILAELGPKPRFKVWWTKYILGGKIFVFIIRLKQIFLSTTKFGRTQKRFGGNILPNTPMCLWAWAELSPESLPLGAFMFVQGG